MTPRLPLHTLILFSLLAAGFGEPGHAAETGFTPIFDGQTLAGWNKGSGDGVRPKYRGGKWTVQDGAIVGCQDPPLIGSFLQTDKKYENFELLIDVNPDWGCDSGVFLRTNDKGQCIQIFLDYLPDGNIGFLYGQSTGGYTSMPWTLEAVMEGDNVVGVRAVDRYDGVAVDGLLYSAKADEFNKVWKHGEFNTLRIRCEGKQPRITTWVNGVKMMEMDGSTFRARDLAGMRKGDLKAPSAWDQAKVLEVTSGNGTIALQVHPGPRWNGVQRYKNIQIKELP